MTNRPINKLARISSDGSKNNFNAINQIVDFLAETLVRKKQRVRSKDQLEITATNLIVNTHFMLERITASTILFIVEI